MREDTRTLTSVRVLALSALLLLAAFIPAAPAAASKTQATMLQDDPELLYGSPALRDKRLNELKSLGVDIVKVRVRWRDLAPKKRPSGFDGSNPASYGAGWAPYEAIVSGAQSRGMGVIFQLGGTAPGLGHARQERGEQPQRERVRQVRAGRRHALPERDAVVGVERAEPDELAVAAGERRRAAGPAHLPRPAERREQRPVGVGPRQRPAAARRAAAVHAHLARLVEEDPPARVPARAGVRRLALPPVPGQDGQEARLRGLQGAARHRPRLPPVHARGRPQREDAEQRTTRRSPTSAASPRC